MSKRWTVAELLGRIANDPGLPKDAPIGFAASPEDDLEVVSVYYADGVVWVDLEPRE